MKKRFVAVFLILLLISTTIVETVAADNGDQPDLVPAGLTWERRTTDSGEQVFLILAVENQGTASVPVDLDPIPTVNLAQIRLIDGEATDIPACTETAPELVGLAAGAAVEHAFACPFPVETPGDYLVTVIVDANNAVSETDEGEENNERNLVPAITTETSALPESINRLFAGLGLFTAVMAVLAVGTEVTVDTLRLLLGMKRKPSSLEALDRLQDMLPGKLEALGVGAAAEKELKNYISGMKKILQPVEQVQNVWEKVQEGTIVDAAKAIIEWWGDGSDPQKQAELETRINEKFGNAIAVLQSKLGLSEELTQSLTNDVHHWIGIIHKDDINVVLNKVISLLQDQVAHITVDWLRDQAATLANQGKGYILDQFKAEVGPELASLLGVDEESDVIKDIYQKLESQLEQLDAKALQSVDVYVNSLNLLMQAVEERRKDMQSPFRKIWRRLRGMRLIGWLVTLIERLFNWVLGRNTNPETFGQAAPVPHLSVESAASYLMSRNDQQRDEEASRLRWLRVVSILVGVVLAYALGIDAAQLLNNAVPGVADTINDAFSIRATQLQEFFGLFRFNADTLATALKHDLTAGIILSGLAASAGSAFWHDQLDRLQAAKKSAEQAAKLAQAAKKLASDQEAE
jgi:hypothetical protein